MTEFWNKAIEFLATSIGQSAIDALGQNLTVSENISRLQATLPRARLLIERSECWCFRYKPIEELLPQLKEAVYETEIRLDEYDSQKRRVEGANWRIPGELINNFMNWMSDFPAKTISTKDTLDHVCDELEKICNNFDIPENPNQFSKTARPITSSDHPTIYGRDEELEDAICLLGVSRFGSGSTKKAKKENMSGLDIGDSSNSTEKKEKLAILPIVGMGGVGKTTVAQMVYKDKCVQSYFDLKIWICASDKFDLERLMKEIIEYVTKKECNLTNLNLLYETLQQMLKSKRILLVLDDIWSTDWQDLLGPMNESSEGSAIILTTRLPEVVQCTGDNMTILDSIRLEGLEENIYWEFFKSCACLEVDSKNYIQLADIARDICIRLKGSPLAAKTLGGLLRKKIDQQHWINIRDSKIWKFKHEEHDIMPVLQLSYQYLPSHLKKCFSFCSLYPKDHEFTDIELAKFWIMEGFIPKTENENLKHMEDLALGYFHELRNSGFFHYKTTSWKSTTYVIHDLMHDICQSITTEECYCLEGRDFGKISHNVHHVSVFQKKLNPEDLREIHKFKKLHSLLVDSPNCGFRAIKSWCEELTSIRCLSLRKCKIKTLPENIRNLKHLQYLDISDTEIQKLPNSFCTLYNLQHLDMWGCNKFLESSGFPDGSNKLTGLQFFRPPLYMVPFLAHMPNLMRSMQLYDITYHVGNDGRNKIENLKHMIGVRGFLDIKELGHVSGKEAAEKSKLKKQELLDTLRLYWDLTSPLSNEIHREVLEGLRPHSNLRVLEISYYKGVDLAPSWMGNELPNLRRVLFRLCANHTISQLPRSITELVLQSCYKLTSLQDCLQPKLLPKLKCVDISWCEELVSLPVESFCGFVSLEKLCIIDCKELTCPKKMVLPPSIKLLHLSRCGELEYSIPSCLQHLTFLEDLSLVDCPHIVSNIPDEVIRNLKSLRHLSVQCCPNLESSIKYSIEHCAKRKRTWDKNPDERQ